MSVSQLSVAYWCVLAAIALPYVASWIARMGAFGPRDNAAPRDWLARQNGWRARANAAQANSFETLPIFIGAVVIAHQLGGAQARIDALALAYVLLRIVYIVLYVKGIDSARSAVWTLAMLVNISIFFVSK